MSPGLSGARGRHEPGGRPAVANRHARLARGRERDAAAGVGEALRPAGPAAVGIGVSALRPRGRAAGPGDARGAADERPGRPGSLRDPGGQPGGRTRSIDPDRTARHPRCGRGRGARRPSRRDDGIRRGRHAPHHRPHPRPHVGRGGRARHPAALPVRRGRGMGARRGGRRRRALRQRPGAHPRSRADGRGGLGDGAARAARLPSRRAPRHRAQGLRARPVPCRLAHAIPRGGHAHLVSCVRGGRHPARRPRARGHGTPRLPARRGPPAYGGRCTVVLAGAGASEEAARAWGAQHLSGDPVTAAQALIAQRSEGIHARASNGPRPSG